MKSPFPSSARNSLNDSPASEYSTTSRLANRDSGETHRPPSEYAPPTHHRPSESRLRCPHPPPMVCKPHENEFYMVFKPHAYYRITSEHAQAPINGIVLCVNCNLRCTIVTSDARMYHLALQTDCRESQFSLDFPRPAAMDAASDLEMAVFGKSFAMRTQASVFDLQLQMDTLP